MRSSNGASTSTTGAVRATHRIAARSRSRPCTCRANPRGSTIEGRGAEPAQFPCISELLGDHHPPDACCGRSPSAGPDGSLRPEPAVSGARLRRSGQDAPNSSNSAVVVSWSRASTGRVRAVPRSVKRARRRAVRTRSRWSSDSIASWASTQRRLARGWASNARPRRRSLLLVAPGHPDRVMNVGDPTREGGEARNQWKGTS
jgi:hypothetical protein